MAQLVTPKPLNPLDDVTQLLGIKQAAQGLKVQQAQMDQAAMNRQQQAELQGIFKDPANWDQQTGQMTDAALLKVGQIHPQTQAELLTAWQRDPKSLSAINLQKAQIENLGVDNRNAEAMRAETNRHNLESEKGKTASAAMALRSKGLKLDEAGNVVPVTREELGPSELAELDDKESLKEARAARMDLDKAKADAAKSTDPNSAAAIKLRQAQERLDLAHERLGLSTSTFNARVNGTDNAGNALPGALITDSGQAVGSTFSANVRPTGQERNKGDMAISAHEQLQDIRSIVQRRPDIFGPAAGRKTDFTVWLGSQDPDAQAFRAARTIAADHLAGTFGGRSEAALSALDDAIGQFKDNPAAVIAGLDQIDKANSIFIQKGTPRTAGSSAVPSTGAKATHRFNPATGKIEAIK